MVLAGEWLLKGHGVPPVGRTPAATGVCPWRNLCAPHRTLSGTRGDRGRSAWFLTIAFSLAALGVCAHPISVSDGTLDLSEHEVALQLTLFIEDFFLFHGLSADHHNRLDSTALAAAAVRHTSFLEQHLHLIDREGKHFSGTAILARPPELPADGVPVVDLMNYTAGYRIVWPMASRPGFLTFVHDFGGDRAFIPSVMRTTVRRSGIEIDYLPQLEKKRPLTLRIDWDQAPIPLTAGQQQQRERERREQDAAMGFASYGSVYSFLYVERFAVRHEILVPLLTLGTFFEIPSDDSYGVSVEAQDALKPALARLFRQRNAVHLEGIRVVPTVDRIDFYGLDFRDFALQTPRQRLNLMTARVGLILTYPTVGAFRQMEVNWDLFTQHVRSVRSTLFTDDQALPVVFSIYRPQLRWEPPNPDDLPPLLPVAAPSPPPSLAIPWVSLTALCLLIGTGLSARLRHRPSGRRLGVALATLSLLTVAAWQPARLTVTNPFATHSAPDSDAAGAVTGALLRNIYRAFEYREEGEIYDALARSVDGDLLHRLYLLIHQGRLMQEQGGAVSRIREVRPVEGQLEPIRTRGGDPSAFAYRIRWQVTGTVEHWGHIHERLHQYLARFEVRARHGLWRITDLEVLDEQRLRFSTRLRNWGNTLPATPPDD